MSEKKIPAISIIIPMYNMEKYIGECLDSILEQTFQDYEVIVADDCSTDRSCEIVESYIPKFENRLSLIKLESNTGAPAIPRNTAVRLSRGEYITFVDSDDAIIPSALEGLYKITQEFDVDMICCPGFYQIPPEKFTTDVTKISEYYVGRNVKEIIHETNDLTVRVKDFANRKYYFWPASYCHLFRRDLILKHNLEFPNLRMGEDRIFNFYAACLAKNILFAPNVYYCYRMTPESACRAPNLDAYGTLWRWGKTVITCIGLLDKFMNQFEQLRGNLELKYEIFESFTEHYEPLWVYRNFSSWEFDTTVRDIISETEDDKIALAAFYFDRMNRFHYKVNGQKMIIDKLQTQIAQQEDLIKKLQGEVN